jgi:hypothetical protein
MVQLEQNIYLKLKLLKIKLNKNEGEKKEN